MESAGLSKKRLATKEAIEAETSDPAIVTQHESRNNDEFNQNLFGLKMLSFNCRSIRNKVTEVTSKLEVLEIDICMLQEKWLNKGEIV